MKVLTGFINLEYQNIRTLSADGAEYHCRAALIPGVKGPMGYPMVQFSGPYPELCRLIQDYHGKDAEDEIVNCINNIKII